MAVGHGGHHGLEPGGDESAATAAATLTASAAAAADWTAAFQVIIAHQFNSFERTDRAKVINLIKTLILTCRIATVWPKELAQTQFVLLQNDPKCHLD